MLRLNIQNVSENLQNSNDVVEGHVSHILSAQVKIHTTR